MTKDNVSTGKFSFQLLWTIGFSGKRFLPNETKAGDAIHAALLYLKELAAKQDVALTSVSSLARGGDTLFAKACLDPKIHIPWKCLLPFEKEEFLKRDFESDASNQPLSEAEIEWRTKEANQILTFAFNHEVFTKGSSTYVRSVVPQDEADAEAAYLECGYQTVNESDVMILLLNQKEWEFLRKQSELVDKEFDPNPFSKCGTAAVGLYALASRHPCIFINAEAEEPSDLAAWHIVGPSDSDDEWFFSPCVSDVIQETVESNLTETVESLPESSDATPVSSSRKAVWELMRRLGGYANQKQKHTQADYKKMLVLHLLASSIAAISATLVAHFLTETRDGNFYAVALWIAALLALMKPLLASYAFFIEQKSHHKSAPKKKGGLTKVKHSAHQTNARELWLTARVMQSICRGAIATWPLPVQPLDAADEEDFPRIKRLLRTLRLMRDMDQNAAVTHSNSKTSMTQPHLPLETQIEADMRVATEYYIEERLVDQIKKYYEPKSITNSELESKWHTLLSVSLIGTIIIGFVLLYHDVSILKDFYSESHHAEEHHGGELLWKLLKALVIIGPFFASFTMGWMTILDCKRRKEKYPEMVGYLSKIEATLKQTSANPSRLRLIEQAERLMIEEQHEWFSVSRNFHV